MLIAAKLYGFNPENPITNFTISENRIGTTIFSSLVISYMHRPPSHTGTLQNGNPTLHNGVGHSLRHFSERILIF